MARGGDQHASALVLVSDLDVSVQDFVDGEVRVQAFDAGTGKFLRDVDVRVLGTADIEIQAGKTDPRGLFVAEGIRGRGTIIARLNKQHYAFHLGSRDLLEDAPTKKPKAAQQAGRDLYFQNVTNQNSRNNALLDKDVQSNINQERRGVQVQRVK